MKATLTFDLPEEDAEHEDAVRGTQWRGIVNEIDNQCRTWIKHGNNFKQPEEALQAIRDLIATESP